jgi:hypothetical protein
MTRRNGRYTAEAIAGGTSSRPSFAPIKAHPVRLSHEYFGVVPGIAQLDLRKHGNRLILVCRPDTTNDTLGQIKYGSISKPQNWRKIIQAILSQEDERGSPRPKPRGNTGAGSPRRWPRRTTCGDCMMRARHQPRFLLRLASGGGVSIG